MVGVALIGALIYRPAREGLGGILKSLLFSRLGIALLILLVYETMVIFIFYKVGLWHWWMLKDALFWLFGSAIILFFNATKATEEEECYFRKVTLDSFKLSVILTFIINLYVFNLIVELILVPVLAFLAVLGAVTASRSEFKQVENLINGIMVTFGIAFLVYAIAGITTDFHGFATLKNLEDFLTPIVLTLTLLPLAYLLGLYSAYESLFVQVSFRLGSDKPLTKYVKRQIMSACRFRLSRVGQFSKDFAYKVGPASSQADVAEVINAFRANENASTATRDN